MDFELDRTIFGGELRGWTIRGIVCAAPSAGWAVMAGFTQPFEGAAMISGMAIYVAVFACFASCRAINATAGRRRFITALQRAVWLKVASLLVAAAYYGINSVVKFPGTASWFAGGVVVDMVGGLTSLSLVASLAGVRGFDAVAHLDSFGWTALATLLQGALITLLLVLLALGVMVWWKLRDELSRKAIFSPSRIAD